MYAKLLSPLGSTIYLIALSALIMCAAIPAQAATEVEIDYVQGFNTFARSPNSYGVGQVFLVPDGPGETIELENLKLALAQNATESYTAKLYEVPANYQEMADWQVHSSTAGDSCYWANNYNGAGDGTDDRDRVNGCAWTPTIYSGFTELGSTAATIAAKAGLTLSNALSECGDTGARFEALDANGCVTTITFPQTITLTRGKWYFLEVEGYPTWSGGTTFAGQAGTSADYTAWSIRLQSFGGPRYDNEQPDDYRPGIRNYMLQVNTTSPRSITTTVKTYVGDRVGSSVIAPDQGTQNEYTIREDAVVNFLFEASPPPVNQTATVSVSSEPNDSDGVCTYNSLFTDQDVIEEVPQLVDAIGTNNSGKVTPDTIIALSAGTCTVTVDFAADGSGAAASDITVFEVTRIPQVLAVTGSSQNGLTNQPVTITTDTTGAPGREAVTLSLDTTQSGGTCALTDDGGGTGSVVAAAAEVCYVKASKSEDLDYPRNYAAAVSPSYSVAFSYTSIEITADDQSISAGDTLTPSYTLTSGALRSGDAIDALTYTYEGTGDTTYAASTTAPTEPGTYTVTPSALTLSSGNLANYTVTYVAGTLSIAVSDSDGDGIDDDSDPFPYAVTKMESGNVTLQTQPPTGSSACSLQSISTVEVATSLTGVAENGSGVGVSFLLSGCDQSTPESILVSIDLGEVPTPGSVAYKIDSNGNWSRILGAEIAGSVVTYTVTDNGPLDLNEAPGIVDDPVTVALPVVIPALPVPVPHPALWIIALGIGAVGSVSLRRQRVG